MLPDPLRLLISAYATGELSPRRRSAAVRLLRHSAEARRLLKELKANRRRLRALPKPELPLDFTARVLNALPERSPIIQPSVLVRPRSDQFSRASRAVMAAAVLVAVAVGAYLFGSLPRQLAVTDRLVTTRPSAKFVATDAPIIDPDVVADNPSSAEPLKRATGSDAVVKNPPAKPRNPGTAPAVDPLGTTAPPPPKLMKVEPPRLLSLLVRDLDSPQARQKLQHELSEADVHHVDLFCKDSTKAFERLQAAIRGRGIKLHVDAVAQETLKRKVRGQFLIFCDDLNAIEWTQALQAVAAADKRAGDGLFDHVVVLPFDSADQKELATVFGADLSQPDARRARAGGADAREPKMEARQAFAAGLFPWRTPANSKDVRQFVDSHRDRASGNIAVLLVLRMPGG